METLSGLVSRLTGVIHLLADQQPHADRTLRACNLVDFDTAMDSAVDRSDEVVLLLVDGEDRLEAALDALAASDPALVIVKVAESDGARERLLRSSVVNAASVSSSLSWGALYVMVDRMIMSGPPRSDREQSARPARHSDLFAIATSLAGQMHGYVSIDDARSRVLAFSPLDEHADQLRRDSILGRGAPAGHHEELRRQGVWERLRIPGHVVQLPPRGHIRSRLAVGVIDDRNEFYLGTIWVQEGVNGFSPAARDYLVAAATLVRQTMLRADYVETRTADAQLQLLGLQLRRESPRTLAGISGLAQASHWIVIGFHATGDASSDHDAHHTLVSLHAASLSPRSRVTLADRRIYVVVPDPPATNVLQRWAERAIGALEQSSRQVNAAIGPLVNSVDALPGARDVVDVLVERLALEGRSGIATYESHRAQLAVSRILQALVERGLLTGGAVEAILATTHVDGEQLLHTLRMFLHGGQHVTSTAAALHIHPNTLRQRLRRVERLTGLSLANPEERLLLDLELRAHADGALVGAPPDGRSISV